MTTETRVAVLVSGSYHDYLRPRDLESSLFRLQEVFKGCDIYYQAWEKDKEIFKGIDALVDIDYVPYPSYASYDPYDLVRENLYEGEWNGIKRFVKKHPTNKDFRTSLFQQLSFAIQWSKVPKKYDYYVRVRWDLHISPSFPLDEVLGLVDKRFVGIATMPSNKIFHHGAQEAMKLAKSPEYEKYEQVRHIRRRIARHIEKGTYTLLTPQPDTHFLYDFMVFFKHGDIKDIDIFNLYENEKLMCNEFGWHQIFCQKRLHYNIDGLVSILRNTDHSWTTFVKLMERRLV